MLEFTQSIDDRDGGVGGHLFHHGVAVRPKNDKVDPAFEVVCDIVERLPGVEPARRLVHEEGAAPQTIHTSLKGQASTQGWLLEEHHHLLAGKKAAKGGWPLFKHGGQVKEGQKLSRREIVNRDEIARSQVPRYQVWQRRFRLR